MGKKKHLVGVSGGLELLGKSPEALDVEDHEGDVHAQAAILSVGAFHLPHYLSRLKVLIRPSSL